MVHLLGGQIQAVVPAVKLLHKLTKGHVDLAPLSKVFTAAPFLLYKHL